MPRAVQFDHYGGVEVLNVVEVPRPTPGASEALVRVKAAGINPGESKIREGANAVLGRDDVLAFWFGESDETVASYNVLTMVSVHAVPDAPSGQ